MTETGRLIRVEEVPRRTTVNTSKEVRIERTLKYRLGELKSIAKGENSVYPNLEIGLVNIKDILIEAKEAGLDITEAQQTIQEIKMKLNIVSGQ